MWMQSERRGIAASMRIIHFEHRGWHNKVPGPRASLGEIVSVIFSCHREMEAVARGASGKYQQGRSLPQYGADRCVHSHVVLVKAHVNEREQLLQALGCLGRPSSSAVHLFFFRVDRVIIGLEGPRLAD